MAAAMHPTEVWSKTQFDKENRLAPGQLELLNSLPGWGNLGTVRARSPNASGCLARTNWHPRRTPRPTLELPLTTTIPPREPQAIPLDETPDASPTNSQDAPEAKAIVRPSQGDFLKRQKGPMLEDSGSDSSDIDDYVRTTNDPLATTRTSLGSTTTQRAAALMREFNDTLNSMMAGADVGGEETLDNL